jgi:hypothetical protein
MTSKQDRQTVKTRHCFHRDATVSGGTGSPGTVERANSFTATPNTSWSHR